MIRDQWARDTLLAMGQEDAGRGTYVHLYINGLYWGMYSPAERPDDAFVSASQGGERDDWDIATLEMYEPAWQQRYLGASVSIKDAIAAKYAAIVMDIAWALFEVRMHRAPERDPNQVWGEICQTYFRISPHRSL